MDREQIETFITLVTYKNFTKSAEMLHVAQSTISARLKNLEIDIGKKLFNRTNRGVQLTTAGHTFLPYAKRLNALFEESRKKVSSKDHFSERLVLGGPSSAWNYIFGNALSTFTSTHRDVALELKTHSSENTISKVLDGIIDVGVSYTKPEHLNLHIHKQIEDEYIFVSKYRKSSYITFDDLISRDFILNHWGESFIEWFLNFTGANYSPAITMNQTSIILKMLQDQSYFTIMPSRIAGPFIQQGLLYSLDYKFDYELPSHQIYVFTSKNIEKLHSVKKILALLDG
jgi:DNA-binding transcriptional LysR family regulator